MKRPFEIIRVLTCIALVAATTAALMAGPCDCDHETGEESADCCHAALPCTTGQAPGSHSGCSCSACPASPAKSAVVPRQASKPHRSSEESSPAFLAGTLKPSPAPAERQPHDFPLAATNAEILRSTILLI